MKKSVFGIVIAISLVIVLILVSGCNCFGETGKNVESNGRSSVGADGIVTVSWALPLIIFTYFSIMSVLFYIKENKNKDKE